MKTVTHPSGGIEYKIEKTQRGIWKSFVYPAGHGYLELEQLAIGPCFAAGQIAVGFVAIGQFAFGKMVLAQVGYGQHVWSVNFKDPVAIDFFKGLARIIHGRS